LPGRQKKSCDPLFQRAAQLTRARRVYPHEPIFQPLELSRRLPTRRNSRPSPLARELHLPERRHLAILWRFQSLRSCADNPCEKHLPALMTNFRSPLNRAKSVELSTVCSDFKVLGSRFACTPRQSRASTTCRNILGSNGFAKYPSIPASRQRSAISLHGVRRHGNNGQMLARGFSFSRIARVASRPPISGICTSIRTRSNVFFSIAASASRPFSATIADVRAVQEGAARVADLPDYLRPQESVEGRFAPSAVRASSRVAS